MKKPSPQQIKMLRMLEGQPNRCAIVPHRLGAIQTAKALANRALVVLWASNYGGRRMAMTPAGESFLASLSSPATT